MFVFITVKHFKTLILLHNKVIHTFSKKFLNGSLNLFDEANIKLFRYFSVIELFLKILIQISVASSSFLYLFNFSMIIACPVTFTVKFTLHDKSKFKSNLNQHIQK